MTDHTVVSRADWQGARDELLRREKEHTRMGDELTRQRQELPWTEVGQEYVLDTDDGPRPGTTIEKVAALKPVGSAPATFLRPAVVTRSVE